MNAYKRRKSHETRTRQGKEKELVLKRYSQTYTLDTLPPEVLETVLRLLPFHDLSSAVRLVSRRCSAVATTILNAAFLAAGRRLKNAMRSIKSRRKDAKSDLEELVSMEALHAMQLVQAQYEMLTAVTWRYTHPPGPQKFSRLCFYAGTLLDDLDNLLRHALKFPESFISPCTVEPSVSCFIALCRRFMYFFEKVSERRVNRSVLVSGCKVVDILDCLLHGRQVLKCEVSSGTGHTGGTVKMKLKYVMLRAWFTCLGVPKSATENSWKDEQRFMYLRLRRLVGSVNEHFLEHLHYSPRNLYLQTLAFAPKVLPSTYSGYGEYGGRFFCYGNMNRNAYNSKFKVPSGNTSANVGEETDEEAYGTLPFNLIVEVELRCSPELAPLSIKNLLCSDEFENPASMGERQEFFLKLEITCPAATANRLPGYFSWELCNS